MWAVTDYITAMKTVSTGHKTTLQPPPVGYMPKTRLGQTLWTLRQKYITDGGKLLDWPELEKEVAQRKGQSH